MHREIVSILNNLDNRIIIDKMKMRENCKMTNLRKKAFELKFVESNVHLH